MLRKCKPIPYQKFPKKQKIIMGTNCVAFALGIKRAKRKNGEYSLKESKDPIEIAVQNKIRKLGFNPRHFTKIEPENESRSKYVIRVYYGFIRELNVIEGKCSFGSHWIRREPDGQWVHKPGFGALPRPVTQEDWNKIHQAYGTNFISLALDT